MDPIAEANDPTLNDANAELDRLIAAEAPEPGEQSAAGTADTTPAASAAPEASKTDPKPNSEKPSDTPATEAQQPKPADTAETDKDKAKANAGKPATEPTPFEKAAGRKKAAWEQINAEKADVRAERERLKAEREQLNKDRAAVDEARKKASAPRHKPEDYDAAADNWLAEAEQLEAKGDYDAADEKRVFAKQSRARARELRANPPATDAQQKAQREAQHSEAVKQWWGKAAIDFPNVAKAGTPENLALQGLIKAEPEVLNDPKGMYYLARLVNAETSAAGVPTMTKEVGDLRAKVKELEGKLQISTDGAAQQQLGEATFENKNEAEQEAELYRLARELPS